MLNLLDFPNEILLHIAIYLNPKDLLRFSHTCKRLYDFLDNEKLVWKRSLKNCEYRPDKVLQLVSNHIIDANLSKFTQNYHKLYLMMHIRTLDSWIAEEPNIISKSVEAQYPTGTANTNDFDMDDEEFQHVCIYNRSVIRYVLTVRNKFYNTCHIRIWDQITNPHTFMETEIDVEHLWPNKSGEILVHYFHVYDHVFITDIACGSERLLVSFKLNFSTNEMKIIWTKSLTLQGKYYIF